RGGGSYQGAPGGGGGGGSGTAVDDIPNWVAPETAAWFRRASAALHTVYGGLPALAFVHIPPHVFRSSQRGGIDPARFPGVNDDVPLAFQGEGPSEEGGGQGAYDDAAFVEALAAETGLHSVYVGHDHGNAWCAPWPGGGGAGRAGRGGRRQRRGGP